MYTKSSSSLASIFKGFGLQFLWYAPYLALVYFAYNHWGYKEIDIKMSIATVLGFAVALLLGFRTSASYDRWWEARKIWGGIINESRTLVRQTIGFTNQKIITDEVKKMGYYQIAWCISLKNSLRDLNPLDGVEEFLSPQEISQLEGKSNVPSEILKLQSKLNANLKEQDLIDGFQYVSIDQTMKDLCTHMGKAERIKKTVFPTQYRSYTHKGVIIFTIMLPFGMLYSTGPFVILICLLVSFFFNMLENIAYYLQDPFMNRASDIPMSSICRTIEINIKELLDEKEVPEAIQPDDKGILM